MDRPEADRDEAEMSDGQLQLRIRAYQREEAWAPRYVANELAATRQAAQHHHQVATTRTVEAADHTEADQRTRLEREAADAKALADLLDTQAADLQQVDEARALWWAHTAGTRAAADRAQAELEPAAPPTAAPTPPSPPTRCSPRATSSPSPQRRTACKSTPRQT